MPTLYWILLFCLLGGVLSVAAAALFLLFSESLRTRLIPHFVSFAIGALLGAAFLGLLPHALSAPGVEDVHLITGTVLVGLLSFFVLEKMVLWRHCHAEHCEIHGVDEHAHKSATGTMVLIGDGIHNLVDGILIAAAFLTDIHLGIVTSMAVAAHEIPQEIGNFAVLLHSGYSRRKALSYNMLASLATLVGGVIAYYGLNETQSALPYVLAIASSSFIYVAVADLIPGLHRRVHISATLQQISLIILGVLVIFVTHSNLH